MKVAKIVGTANAKTWSQVHEFLPSDEKLSSHGQLMAALAFEVKKEGVEVSSFGTEMITRLQEMYYSNESKSLTKKIEQTMESLKAEFFNEVELEMVMMVGLGVGDEQLLYAGRRGGGQVYLKRNISTVKLLKGDREVGEVVSGKIMSGDKLVAGTSRFFKMVKREDINSSLKEDGVNEVMEGLAAVVHGQESNSQAAAVVGLVEIEAGKEALVVDEEGGYSTPKQETRHLPGKINEKSVDLGAFAPKRLIERVGRKIKDQVKKLQPKAVRVRSGDPKKQKSAATMALVLVLVFGVSLVLAGRKRQKTKKEAAYQAVMEETRYKYDEAMGLVELNPLRAKSLLSDSKTRIEEFKMENEKANGELDDYLVKIEEALSGVQREYEVEEATEWFDFSLTKDGFKASDWEIEELSVLAWDTVTKTAVELNLETKASSIIVGGDKVSGGSLVGLAGNRGMVVDKDLVTVVDTEDEEVVVEIGDTGWGKIVDAVGFSSNLYLLDGTSEGQIYKYLGVKSGLSAQRNYLTGETYDLSEAVSMAIDGSVWVLFADGTIVKYVRGVKDPFTISGLDEDFSKPVKIFTSPEVENLYVLDQQKTRVVVIDKSGEYQAQYRWPGIAGVKDLVVSEDLGKIYLLTGEKVFVIELRGHSPPKIG